MADSQILIRNGCFMTNPIDKFAGLKIPALDADTLQKAAFAAAGIARVKVAMGAAGLDKLDTSPMASVAAGLSGMSERMKSAIGAAGLEKLDTSPFARLSKQIADQQRAIAGLRPSVAGLDSIQDFDMYRPRRMPELKIPPNPILETNKRLKNIEARFDRMEKIALDGAEIATGLQASAATFLEKFEAVAVSNDRITKRAVLIGVVAIVIAVLTPIAQVLYTEMYRAPADAATVQSTIADVKREISGLRETQEHVANRISEALLQNGKDQTATLKEIKELLANQPQPLVFVP